MKVAPKLTPSTAHAALRGEAHRGRSSGRAARGGRRAARGSCSQPCGGSVQLREVLGKQQAALDPSAPLLGEVAEAEGAVVTKHCVHRLPASGRVARLARARDRQLLRNGQRVSERGRTIHCFHSCWALPRQQRAAQTRCRERSAGMTLAAAGRWHLPGCLGRRRARCSARLQTPASGAGSQATSWSRSGRRRRLARARGAGQDGMEHRLRVHPGVCTRPCACVRHACCWAALSPRHATHPALL